MERFFVVKWIFAAEKDQMKNERKTQMRKFYLENENPFENVC